MKSILCVGFMSLAVLFIVRTEARSCEFPAIFNFGDSTSDTGNVHFAFPNNELAEHSPYGQTFFGKPASRYCDGRLSLDFFANALGMPFLSPYLQSVGSNFAYGANFAAAGATARTTNSFIAPISLQVQINQFKVFKQQVLNSIQAHGPLSFLPSQDAFSKGIYIIEIGGNDFSYAYMQLNMNNTQLLQSNILPKLAKTVAGAVQELYNEGARTIMVKDVGPQGCGAFWLSYFGAKDVDVHGCSMTFNNAAKTYNRILRAEMALMRSRMKDARVVYVNTYDIIYDLYSNPGAYGFKETTKACCGVGGEYNYDYSVQCGVSGIINGASVEAKSCDDPSTHVMWDGVHWTEAANRVITRQILSGRFFQPPSFSLAASCDLTSI